MLDHGKQWPVLGAAVEPPFAIVAQCRLEPGADANLHLVVAELLAGADAMPGKSRTPSAAGAAQVVRAVNQYGRHFNHPEWKPLA